MACVTRSADHCGLFGVVNMMGKDIVEPQSLGLYDVFSHHIDYESYF